MGISKRMESRKVWHIVIFIALEVIVLGVYFLGGKWAGEEGRKESIRKQTIAPSNKLLREIENVEIKNGTIIFSGWAFYPNAQNKEIALVLRNVESAEEHVVLCDLLDKDGVTNYFFDEAQSKNIGFCANIKEAEIEKNSCYEIIINLVYQTRVEGKTEDIEIKVLANCFYYDGQIFEYNPKEFVKPEMSDEKLTQVLEQGKVRAYDIQDGMWVYQYEQKLYYIIDSRKNCVGVEDGVSIPVMSYTSRIDLLSEERQQYGSDHLGAYYANEIYITEGIVPYQIVEVELPLEYPITYIKTGLYDNAKKEWIKSLYILMYDWRAYDEKQL